MPVTPGKNLKKTNEDVRIQNDICTPHVIRNKMVPSFCKLLLLWRSYNLCYITEFFMKCIFVLSFYNASF